MPTDNVIREAHAIATADVDCDLIWDTPFMSADYSYVVNGFEPSGNPAELFLVSKSSTKIVIRTMVNANLYALAKLKKL